MINFKSSPNVNDDVTISIPVNNKFIADIRKTVEKQNVFTYGKLEYIMIFFKITSIKHHILLKKSETIVTITPISYKNERIIELITRSVEL